MTVNSVCRPFLKITCSDQLVSRPVEELGSQSFVQALSAAEADMRTEGQPLSAEDEACEALHHQVSHAQSLQGL